MTQLRCEAGQRQSKAHRHPENGGGLYGIEEAVVGVNIRLDNKEATWDTYSAPKSSRLPSMD